MIGRMRPLSQSSIVPHLRLATFLLAELVIAAMVGTGPSPLHAQAAAPARQEAIPIEFAELLLGSGRGAQYLVGEVSPRLPGADTLAVGARVIGSVVASDRIETALAVPQPVAEARQQLEARLLAAGWTQRPEPTGPLERGFLPAYAEDPNRGFCWPDTDAQLSATVRKSPTGGAYLVLQYLAPGDGRTCAAPRRTERPPGSELQDLMPTLRPPDGTELTGGGSGYSGSYAETSSTAYTELPPRELIAAFVPQLREQEWTALEEVAGNAIATVFARKPRDNGPELLLWVSAYRIGVSEQRLSMWIRL
jgi:hypothetical protein